MWSRADVKLRGKAAFLQNFWLCVLVAAILSFATGGNSNANSNTDTNNHGSHANAPGAYGLYDQDAFDIGGNFARDGADLAESARDLARTLRINLGPLNWTMGMLATGLGLLIAAVVMGLGLLFSVFVMHPLEVGCKRFFLINLNEKARIQELGYAFTNGWLNTGWVLFLREIKLFLWTMLFIVPGIIKAYEYRMIPYLLAEDPNMNAADAFEESRRLMYGSKMDAFMLDLSFIGWHILSVVTLGLAEIFWTGPYVESTGAALYDTLSGGYIPYDGM